QKPAIIRGVAQAAGADQESMTSFYRPSISYLPEMVLVAKQVYAQAGQTPKDLDAAVISDAFTSIVLWQIESFGFCGRGEAKEFIRGGTLRRNGRRQTHDHRAPP